MSANFHVEALSFGTVIEVRGVTITLEAEKLRAKHDSTEYAVELGNLVLIHTPQSDLIATISTIQLIASSDKESKTSESRLVHCTLVGFLRDGTTFERGIERYPTIDSRAFLLTATSLTTMFKRADRSVTIGER